MLSKVPLSSLRACIINKETALARQLTVISLVATKRVVAVKSVKVFGLAVCVNIAAGIVLAGSSYAQAVCQAQQVNYNKAVQVNEYYMNAFDRNPNCATMRNSVNASRNRVLSGRQLDNCLRAYGAMIGSDDALVNAFNRMNQEYNRTCGGGP